MATVCCDLCGRDTTNLNRVCNHCWRGNRLGEPRRKGRPFNIEGCSPHHPCGESPARITVYERYNGESIRDDI